MKKIDTLELLKDMGGASLGVLIYNLIFHNDESYMSILLRSLIVGCVTGIIIYFFFIKQRN